MISASSASRRGTTWCDGSLRASARSKLPSGPVVSSVTSAPASSASSRPASPVPVTMCVAPESTIACRSAASGNR